ncbi:MAG: hypothetical protein ACYDC6_16340 [Acidobacteriaceae bacterium]
MVEKKFQRRVGWWPWRGPRVASIPARPVDTKSSEARAGPSGLTVCLSGQRRIEAQRGFDASVLERLVELLERA